MALVDPEKNEDFALIIPMEQEGSGESQELKLDRDVDVEIVPQSRTGKLMQVYFKTTPYKFGATNPYWSFHRLMKRSKFGHVIRLM